MFELSNKTRGRLSGFTANFKIREIRELSGTFKMDLFYWKNQGIIKEFWFNVREIREKFPRKCFFNDKFPIGFIFSYVHSHVMKHFPTFYCYIMLQPGSLCLKMQIIQCNMLDCWMMNHKQMNYLLKWLTYTGIKNSDSQKVNFYTVVF